MIIIYVFVCLLIIFKIRFWSEMHSAQEFLVFTTMCQEQQLPLYAKLINLLVICLTEL